ncbi:MAG: aconitase X catalytic domain-containing protein [Dehalococcoidales bacterium]|nr:aconitase X catalytic domain-containing protein [Dehalococcoidales bacterium]
MYLTNEEKRMLSGESGPGLQLAMEVVTRIGEGYGARRLLPIHSAHVAAVYPHLLASVELVEKFAATGAKFRIPTTLNNSLQPANFYHWKDLPKPPLLRANATRIKDAIEKLGVIRTYSCTPYFQGNVPRFGEVISWVESSAICFANSALGARTNRTTMGMDIAAALAARVPEFGLLLDEDRVGNALIKLEFQPKTMYEYGACGYLIGKLCSGKLPVIEGLPQHTNLNNMKIMSGAAASEGGIAMFHAVGITPEARTREEAFKGNKPDIEVKIGKAEVKAAIEDIGELSTFKGKDIDAVLIGCPYPTVEEIGEVAGYLQGRKVKKSIKFCIFASEDVVNYSRQLGYVDIIEGAGADIMQGECVVSYPTKEWKWKKVMTNSAKYAIILPSDPTWLDVWYADTRECVEIATTKK